MSTMLAPAEPALTADDFLAWEQAAEGKHEYLAGQVLAMGGASRRHGLVAGALYAALHPHARRAGCQLFAADMKVRVDHEGDSWLYYPDLVLACASDDDHALFVRKPCLLVEVLSPSTETIDTREKLLAYRLLPSLREYLLLRQDRIEATLYQRGESGWRHRVLRTPEDELAFECLPARVALQAIYADTAALM